MFQLQIPSQSPILSGLAQGVDISKNIMMMNPQLQYLRAQTQGAQLNNQLSQLKLNTPALLAGGMPAQAWAYAQMLKQAADQQNNQPQTDPNQPQNASSQNSSMMGSQMVGSQALSGLLPPGMGGGAPSQAQGMPPQSAMPQTQPQGSSQLQGLAPTGSTPSMYLNQPGMDPNNTNANSAQFLQMMMQNQMRQAQAQGAYYTARSIPPAQLQEINGRLSNIPGYNQADTARQMYMGYGPEQIAAMHGYDYSSLPYNAPESQATINQTQTQAKATAGLDSVGDSITSGLSVYASPVNALGSAFGVDGSSVQAFSDANSKDPARQAKAANFIASRAMVPEMAALRAKAQTGAAIGSDSINQFSEAAYGNLDSSIIGKTNPDVYKMAQDLINQRTLALAKSESQQATSANPNVYNGNQNNSQFQQASQQSQPSTQPSNDSGFAQMIDSSGRQYHIPITNVDKAVKRGLKRVS